MRSQVAAWVVPHDLAQGVVGVHAETTQPLCGGAPGGTAAVAVVVVIAAVAAVGAAAVGAPTAPCARPAE